MNVVGYVFPERGSPMFVARLKIGRVEFKLGLHESVDLAEAAIRGTICEIKEAIAAFEADEIIHHRRPAAQKREPPVWLDEDCRAEVLQAAYQLLDHPLDGGKKGFVEKMLEAAQADDFRVSMRQMNWLRELAANLPEASDDRRG